MSFIDTIDHSHVGYLFDIPVYHVMGTEYNQTYHPSYADDMFVIGGGSGEHGMFIIQGIDEIVSSYLFQKYDMQVGDFDLCELDNMWTIEESANVYERNKHRLKETDLNSIESLIIHALGEFICRDASHLINDVELKNVVISNASLFNSNYYGLEREFDNPYGRVLIDNVVSWGVSFDDEDRFLNKEKML